MKAISLFARGVRAGAVAALTVGCLFAATPSSAQEVRLNLVTAFPFATLAANAAGSLLMGLLAGWLARPGSGEGEQLRLLLGVGLLGGFTTFSAFSLEMVLLLERGNYLFALLYAILSLALGITGLMVGLGIMRIAG